MSLPWKSFALAFGFWLFVGCSGDAPTPSAQGGVLDLRAVDLSERVVDLTGPWESVPGVVAPEMMDSAHVTDSVSLPVFWRRALPGRTATFRLRLVLPERLPPDLLIATNQRR